MAQIVSFEGEIERRQKRIDREGRNSDGVYRAAVGVLGRKTDDRIAVGIEQICNCIRIYDVVAIAVHRLRERGGCIAGITRLDGFIDFNLDCLRGRMDVSSG